MSENVYEYVSIDEMEKTGLRLGEINQEVLELAAAELPFRFFQDELKDTGIMFFRPDLQDNEHNWAGHAQPFITKVGGYVYIIFLSLDAAKRGPAYLSELLCHELAHVMNHRENGDCESHGPEFTRQYKKLLKKYRAKARLERSGFDFSGAKVRRDMMKEGRL